jgi:23S rRNA pseudouridine1911/1915/1917 synthase
MARKLNFTIVYQDEHLILVNKLPGISVIRERDARITANLLEEVSNFINCELLLVHRVDKDTSGLVLFAKTSDAQKELSEQFLLGKVRKKYLAIVGGKVEKDDWQSIDFPIFKKQNAIKVSIHPKGKKSKTLYRTKELFPKATILEVEILTGRTHQIRIHLAEIGIPLLVDPLYGKKSELMLSELMGGKYKRSKFKDERPIMARQTLHAAELSFIHPGSSEKMEFEAELPKDWKALVNQMRKASL